MFIVLMLQKLAELPKLLGAFRAMIRMIRYASTTVPSSVLKHRRLRQVSSHRSLGIRELINLIPGVDHSGASRATTGFDMLDCICARFEANLATNGTGNTSCPVCLHMHIQLVLGIECIIALITLIVDCGRGYVVLATRRANLATGIGLAKLIATEMTIGEIATTIFTSPSHDSDT